MTKGLQQSDKSGESLISHFQLLEAIVESAPDPIFAKDAEARFILVNSACARVLGRPRIEIYGRRMSELVDPAQARQVEFADAQILATGEPLVTENSLASGDRVRVYMTTRSALRNAAGEVIGILGIAQDITERKKREEALGESEAQYRLLAETIPQLVWMADAAGTLQFCNQYFRDVTGLTLQEAVNRGHELIHPEDRPAAAEKWAEAVERGRAYEVEYRLQNSTQGSYTWFSARIQPVKDKNGQVLRWVGTAVDIDERKKTEEELAKQAAELARSNNDLQQFSSIASHDLQEPLRNMAICSELLNRGYRHLLDDNGKQLVDLISSGARAGQALTQALLSYARTVGPETAPTTPVSIGEAFDQAIANLKSIIQESGAVVTRTELPQVNGDRIQLVQLFQNLIENAIKYRSEIPPTIHVDCTRRGGEWQISVTDNGVGIPESHYGRIFEPFQRLRNAKISGSGLGLATCKRIVERHGGAISVKSRQGEGSTFLFTLKADS